MNLHQLRVFYEVAQTRSFSTAAKKLHLTQPAVTWHVKSLEESYELKFFDRIGKTTLLTEDGKVLFHYADRILNLTRQAEEALADVRGLSRGALRIDSTFTFGDFYLPPLLDAFHRKHPKITVQVGTGNSSQIVENTLLHKNDLAIVAIDPSHDKLEAREIATDFLVAVVSTAHPMARRKSIALEELIDQPLILRESGGLIRRIIDEILGKGGIRPNIIMESSSTSVIKKMVESGWGMAILSPQVLKRELQDRTLKMIPFRDAAMVYRFYMIFHKDRYISRALSAFIALASEFFQKARARLEKDRVSL